MKSSELKDVLKRSVVVRSLSYCPKKILDKMNNLRYRRSEYAQDIRQFKNKHLGEACFVIGNGPSLTIEDLERLQGCPTFASNLLYKLFDQTSFRPTYYVNADIGFFPTYFNELIQYEGIDAYFVGDKGAKIVELPSNAHCFNVQGPFTLKKGSLKNNDFSLDASHHLALSYTVTYYSLQLAVYMGFKTIYLIGVDHRYAGHVDEKGKLHQDSGQERSYAKGIAAPLGAGWNYADSTTYSYCVARQAAEKQGVQIINATRGGDLEVFDRIDTDAAIVAVSSQIASVKNE